MPGLRLVVNGGGGSFKSQLKRANRSGAGVALILGEEELENSQVGLKYLRDNREQVAVGFAELDHFLMQQVKDK